MFTDPISSWVYNLFVFIVIIGNAAWKLIELYELLQCLTMEQPDYFEKRESSKERRYSNIVGEDKVGQVCCCFYHQIKKLMSAA